VRLDYLLNDARHTRFSFETIIASGDPDRINSSNTFAGNRLARRTTPLTGLACSTPGWHSPPASPICSPSASAHPPSPSRHGPFRRLQVGTDFFVFSKMRENGGIDEVTTSGRYLGVEPDVYLNWQIKSDVTLVLRYGVFFPNGDVIVNDDARQFFFGGITFAF